MSNFGKFRDRSPLICPAGMPSGDSSVKVANSLKDYRLEYQVDALKHDAGIFKEPPFKYPLPKLPTRHPGIFTDMRPILGRPVKTRYQTLINDLKETPYESYWNKLEGKCRDYLPGVPAGMDPTEIAFGKPTAKDEKASTIVLPPLKPYEVQWNGQVGHEFYKKSHNSYNPSEHRNRNYLKPAYCPKRCYGEKSGSDPRGIWVKCACHWHITEPIRAANRIEADVNKRLKREVGKVYAPQDNISCVPKGHMFGKPSDRPMLGVEDLLRDADVQPCIFKRDFETWMKYLNEVRIFLKKQINNYDFNLREFEDQIMHYDKEHTGWVPLDLFYALCECYGVHYEYTSLEPFFDLCGVIKDGLINYRDYCYLVNINSSVPEIMKFDDVPKGNQYYVSTYRASSCDYLLCDNSKLHTAGLPTYRFDLPRTIPPAGGCLADIENLGDETSAGGIVNPSIFTTYGLSHRDLFQPRQPDQIRKLFEKVGYTFPENTFEKLWSIGQKRDTNCLVCVETFKNLLKETVPPSTFTAKGILVC